MITALLLGLLFIAFIAAFLLFLFFILYPSLEQQGFPVEEPFVKPWPPRWLERRGAPPFLFNTPTDCFVVRHLHGTSFFRPLEGRKAVCDGFEGCVDRCPRLDLLEKDRRGCVFVSEFHEKQRKYYRIVAGRLRSFLNKSGGKV